MKFLEAIAFSKRRNVVLPSVYYSLLQRQARAQAFTVSFLQSISQIKAVLDSLNAALEDGSTLENWRDSLPPLVLTEAHLETVFRNGLMTAYNVGRWRQFEANKSERPMLMYDAVNDERTRPTHARMDGFIAPIDSAVWNTWTPPNGHNCRCHLVSLDEAQAERRGGTSGTVPVDSQGQPVTPDDGWDYNPYLAQLAVEQGGEDAFAQSPEAKLVQQKLEEMQKANPIFYAAALAIFVQFIIGGQEVDTDNN